jgi:hypothetical protein
MAHTRKKKAAPVEPPLSNEQLSERIREVLQARALTKAELPKKLGLSSKVDATRSLDVARELARKGDLHRFAKGAVEVFFGDDPVAELDRLVPVLLRQQGPLGATALKKAVKSALPGHDALLADWLKSAISRGVLYESGKPKLLSPEPPAPDLDKLLKKELAALKKQVAALETKGIARELIATFLRNALALGTERAAPPVAGARSSREVFLDALQRLAADSPEGALLPVRELRARAGLGKQDFDAAALALSKEGLLVLHYHDHASALSEAEQNALVRDALGRHYVGVALRGSA